MDDLEQYKTQRINDLQRFWTFTRERFDPLSHFVMLALFLWAHFLLLIKLNLLSSTYLQLILVSIGVVVFFFKLRLYDEIKDYDTDVKINPTRPLPRGLVTMQEVKRGIEYCLVLEIILFASAGYPGLFGILFATTYSLLMYHEFFIGDLIRPHLTTYATSHTVVTLFLSLAIFQASSNLMIWDLPIEIYLFAFISWLLFNIFELGRKTYMKHEEKGQVESYSKVWTRPGAVALVLIHAIIATYLTLNIDILQGENTKVFLWSIVGLIALFGVFLNFPDFKWAGKTYRGFSSFYIVLIYSGIVLKLLL
jgi:hypothetical protein